MEISTLMGYPYLFLCMRPNRERALMELDFDQYKVQQFCDNPECQYYGKTGADNIRTHSRRHQQVYCNSCKKYLGDYKRYVLLQFKSSCGACPGSLTAFI